MLRALRAMINAHAQLSYRSCSRLCIEGVLHCALIRHLEKCMDLVLRLKTVCMARPYLLCQVSITTDLFTIIASLFPTFCCGWMNYCCHTWTFRPWFYIHNYIAPYKFVYTKTLLLQNVIIYALNRGFTIPWITSSGIIGGSHLEYPLYSFNVQYAHFESCRARVVNGNAGTIDHQPCKEHPSGTWYNIHSDFNSWDIPCQLNTQKWAPPSNFNETWHIHTLP